MRRSKLGLTVRLSPYSTAYIGGLSLIIYGLLFLIPNLVLFLILRSAGLSLLTAVLEVLLLPCLLISFALARKSRGKRILLQHRPFRDDNEDGGGLLGVGASPPKRPVEPSDRAR